MSISKHKEEVLRLLKSREISADVQLKIAEQVREERKKLRRPNPNPAPQSVQPAQPPKRNRRMSHDEMTKFLIELYGIEAVTLGTRAMTCTMPEEGHPKAPPKRSVAKGAFFGEKSRPERMFEPHPAESLLTSGELYSKIEERLYPSTAKNRDGKRSEAEKTTAKFRKQVRRHKQLMQQGGDR